MIFQYVKACFLMEFLGHNIKHKHREVKFVVEK